MSLDIIRTGLRTLAKSKTGSGASNINGGIITIPLDKTWLTSELRLLIAVAQVWTTAIPTSSDVRRFFKTAQLVTDKGDGVKLNFHAAYDLARFTESVKAPVVDLGAAPGDTATALFDIELHGKNDGAIGAMITSWLAGKYASLELQLEVAADADNGFIGGTLGGVASYSVDVYPSEYRTMTPLDRGDTSTGWGIAEHSGVMLSNLSGDVSGFSGDIDLKTGNKTRFLALHAFNAASGGSLTDAVFMNGAAISLTIDGQVIYNNTKLSEIKTDNAAERGFNQTGVVILDAGDDPLGWWDLRNVRAQKLEVNIPASASLPAAWRVEVAQDYTKGLEDLPDALRA